MVKKFDFSTPVSCSDIALACVLPDCVQCLLCSAFTVFSV